MQRVRGAIIGIVASVLLSLPVADAQSVSDSTRFFSPVVVKQVEQQLSDLAAKHDVQMVVETFASIPAEKQAEFHSYSPPRREVFFTKWAKERAAEVKARDVYILVCNKPGQFNVEISRGMQVRGFTLDDRDAFRNVWLAALRANERDLALEAAVENLSLIATRLKPAANVDQQNDTRQVAATNATDSGRSFAYSAPNSGKRMANGVFNMAAITVVGLAIGLIAAGFLMNRMFHPMSASGSDFQHSDSHLGREGSWTGGMIAGVFAALFGGWYYNSMPATSVIPESDSPTCHVKAGGCCWLGSSFESVPNGANSDGDFPYADFSCGDIGAGDGGSF